MTKALYISYFGVREPLVQTQVLPYLRELVNGGVEMTLLTFESAHLSSDDCELIMTELRDQNIRWRRLRYHSRPRLLATAFDIFMGTVLVGVEICRGNAQIIHARSHVSAVIAELASSLTSWKKTKTIFDIRGFLPEEYVDAGILNRDGLVYKSVKRVERWLLRRADGLVVLTERAAAIIKNELGRLLEGSSVKHLQVIPCCVDLTYFSPVSFAEREASRKELNLESRLVIAYVGSLDGWYMTDEMFEFLSSLRKTNANTFAMILTRGDRLRVVKALEASGFESSDYLVMGVAPKDIRRYLSAADAAISFVKPTYSKQASSPTKNAEYLACGLPIVVNAGVGDTDSQIATDRVGVVISEFSESNFQEAAGNLERLFNEGETLRNRCVASAEKHFSLIEVGGPRYRELYRLLLQ